MPPKDKKTEDDIQKETTTEPVVETPTVSVEQPAEPVIVETPVEVIPEPIRENESVPEIVAESVSKEIPPEIKAEEVIPETEIKIDPEPAKQAQEEAPVVAEPVEQTPPETAPTPNPTPPQSQTESAPQTQTPEPKIKTIEKIVYKTDPNIIQTLLIKARAVIQERKRKKLDKIMALFEASPQIRSKDVQKALRMIKRTSTRYLDQLEQEGKIIQVGKKGKGVLYIKKP